jgi:hypothetical protein
MEKAHIVMRRRTFLICGVGLASQLFGHYSAAQGDKRGPRAAVVVGVDKAGDLPALHGAAAGAHQIADWLGGEGFEVKLFADDQKRVRVGEIFDAIDELVGRGTLDQLVIYFSGHGFLVGTGEYWMLSNAPSNPNEAVNLSGSVALARQSAIPSVVFISDACRSTADSLRANNVQGSLIFPNKGINQNGHTYIDQFLATLPGNPAFEVSVDKSMSAFQGIFTTSFLAAFRDPPANIVKTVDDLRYVPNRNLEEYLETDVRRRAEAISIRLRQRPDARVESSDTTYIARVAANTSSPVVPPTTIPTTLRDVASFEISTAGADLFKSARVMSANKINDLSLQSGFTKSRELILHTQSSWAFDSKSGFVVTGAPLRAVAVSSGLEANILDRGDGSQKPGLVDVRINEKGAGSVALQFADGGGTIVAALHGFVGSVVIESGGVINVSYLPDRNTPRWFNYEPERERLDKLRAAVATSAQYGEFRVEGSRGRGQAAEQLANQIRILKGIDPTLAIYAAYAYAEAGLLEKVISVSDALLADLGVNLFDVNMLSGPPNKIRARPIEKVAPFCPMLTQGWNLLQAKGVLLPPEVAGARNYLRPALWTTFESEGYAAIRVALQQGNVQ